MYINCSLTQLLQKTGKKLFCYKAKYMMPNEEVAFANRGCLCPSLLAYLLSLIFLPYESVGNSELEYWRVSRADAKIIKGASSHDVSGGFRLAQFPQQINPQHG